MMIKSLSADAARSGFQNANRFSSLPIHERICGSKAVIPGPSRIQEEQSFAISYDVEPDAKRATLPPREWLCAVFFGAINLSPKLEFSRRIMRCGDIPFCEKTEQIDHIVRKGTVADLHDFVVNKRFRQGTGVFMPSILEHELADRFLKAAGSSRLGFLPDILRSIPASIGLSVIVSRLIFSTGMGSLLDGISRHMERMPFLVEMIGGALGAFAGMVLTDIIASRSTLTRMVREILDSGEMTCSSAKAKIFMAVERYGNPRELSESQKNEMLRLKEIGLLSP